jgi:3-mercaptopyruvate sulfurtransferase SseA
VALQLRKAGIRRVRPLAGGFEAWRAGGFPVEAVLLASGDSPVNTLLDIESLPDH